jgi:hypothetical protein
MSNVWFSKLQPCNDSKPQPMFLVQYQNYMDEKRDPLVSEGFFYRLNVSYNRLAMERSGIASPS